MKGNIFYTYIYFLLDALTTPKPNRAVYVFIYYFFTTSYFHFHLAKKLVAIEKVEYHKTFNFHKKVNEILSAIFQMKTFYTT